MFVILVRRNASDVSCQQREDAETLAERASKNRDEESEELPELTSSCRCSTELTGVYLTCPGRSTETLSFLTKNGPSRTSLFQPKRVVPYPERVYREHFVDGEAVVQGGSMFQVS